jgi:hypothetical protein
MLDVLATAGRVAAAKVICLFCITRLVVLLFGEKTTLFELLWSVLLDCVWVLEFELLLSLPKFAFMPLFAAN